MEALNHLSMIGIEWVSITPFDDGMFMISLDMEEEYAVKLLSENGYVVENIYRHTPTESVYVIIRENT